MNTPKDEETIFAAALALPPQERAACLDQACGGDSAVRRRVEVLLNSHAAGAFLEEPAGPVASHTLQISPPVSERPGDRIGRYKLLQQIGEGGCGVVYMAEQDEPVQRRVALKVIKLGMDTRQVIARFEAERQALALMDHPNIAKVLDGAATEAGRPYFVMELVRGVKITEFCDHNNLPTRERLDLFIQVCRAIQHAASRLSGLNCILWQYCRGKLTAIWLFSRSQISSLPSSLSRVNASCRPSGLSLKIHPI